MQIEEQHSTCESYFCDYWSSLGWLFSWHRHVLKTLIKWNKQVIIFRLGFHLSLHETCLKPVWFYNATCNSTLLLVIKSMQVHTCKLIHVKDLTTPAESSPPFVPWHDSQQYVACPLQKWLLCCGSLRDSWVTWCEEQHWWMVKGRGGGSVFGAFVPWFARVCSIMASKRKWGRELHCV